MNQRARQKFIGGGIILIVLVLSLALVYNRESSADPIGEPLDDNRRALYQGTALEFIAETGRVVVTERGAREIVWDPPQLPTLDESIRMAAAARASGDSSLLPLCTDEYTQYLKTQKESDSRSVGLPTNSNPPSFPACHAVPDRIVFGPRSGPAPYPHPGMSELPSTNTD